MNDLLCMHLTNSSLHHGGILAVNIDQTAVHQTIPRDHSVRRFFRGAFVEVCAAACDTARQFNKAAGIK